MSMIKYLLFSIRYHIATQKVLKRVVIYCSLDIFANAASLKEPPDEPKVQFDILRVFGPCIILIFE